MKSILIAAVLAAGIAATGVASADGGEDVAKKSGCLNCHAVDTKKVGPAYKEVAKKFKGKSTADVVAAMKAVPVHCVGQGAGQRPQGNRRVDPEALSDRNSSTG